MNKTFEHSLENKDYPLSEIKQDNKELVKRAKKSLHVSETYLLRSKVKTLSEFCANCQMPNELLHRWESMEVHASSCVETDFQDLEPCLEEQHCKSNIRSHYAKFNHMLLASFRDARNDSTISSKYVTSYNLLDSLDEKPLQEITKPKSQRKSFHRTSSKSISSERLKQSFNAFFPNQTKRMLRFFF